MARRNMEPGIGRKSEEEPSVEESALASYWRIFKFVGRPPKAGSPLETRISDLCATYTRANLDPRLSNAMGDRRRADLHDELSVVVYGKHRNDLPDSQVQSVADFASLVTTGMTMSEAINDHVNKIEDTPGHAVSDVIRRFR